MQAKSTKDPKILQLINQSSLLHKAHSNFILSGTPVSPIQLFMKVFTKDHPTTSTKKYL